MAGALTATGGQDWWLDGVEVTLRGESGEERRAATDATGFFGFVDVAAGRYRLVVKRAGTVLHASAAVDVAAGRVTRYDVALREEELRAALPRVTATGRGVYAPGDVVTLSGVNLAAETTEAQGAGETLLGGVRVYRKDGTPVALRRVSPERIEFVLPERVSAVETFTVRHSGMDSANVTVRTGAAAPVIEQVTPLGQGAFELLASGAGAKAGTLRVLYAGGAADVLETAAVAGRPGAVRISVMVEPEAKGEFRLDAGGVSSPPFPF